MRFKEYMNEAKPMKGKNYDLLKTGGKSTTKITSFSASEPGEYDILDKQGNVVGKVNSMKDPNYPKANISKWIIIMKGEKTKDFQYFKKAKEYILKELK
jgi:hypothetical protein